jgi:hypothetical protein
MDNSASKYKLNINWKQSMEGNNHTWASQRTTAMTRSLYSSILRGGNKKCLRAYSCTFHTQKIRTIYIQISQKP